MWIYGYDNNNAAFYCVLFFVEISKTYILEKFPNRKKRRVSREDKFFVAAAAAFAPTQFSYECRSFLSMHDTHTHNRDEESHQHRMDGSISWITQKKRFLLC